MLQEKEKWCDEIPENTGTNTTVSHFQLRCHIATARFRTGGSELVLRYFSQFVML